MATLTAKERRTVEILLKMGGGYVLNFADRTFGEFFRLDIGVDIDSDEFANRGGSKANRLRSFFEVSADQLVGHALEALLEYGHSEACLGGELEELEQGRQITQRLKASTALDIAALIEASDGASDILLLRHIEDSIRQHEPQGVTDRLHTFTLGFVRRLCASRDIEVAHRNGKQKTLDSIFGEYVKQLKAAGQIESAMGEKILRTAISVLSDYNDVRNNQSLAHYNPVLGRDEAALIVSNVANLIKFVQSVEAKIATKNKVENQVAVAQTDDLNFPPEEELPF